MFHRHKYRFLGIDRATFEQYTLILCICDCGEWRVDSMLGKWTDDQLGFSEGDDA